MTKSKSGEHVNRIRGHVDFDFSISRKISIGVVFAIVGVLSFGGHLNGGSQPHFEAPGEFHTTPLPDNRSTEPAPPNDPPRQTKPQVTPQSPPPNKSDEQPTDAPPSTPDVTTTQTPPPTPSTSDTPTSPPPASSSEPPPSTTEPTEPVYSALSVVGAAVTSALHVVGVVPEETPAGPPPSN